MATLTPLDQTVLLNISGFGIQIPPFITWVLCTSLAVLFAPKFENAFCLQSPWREWQMNCTSFVCSHCLVVNVFAGCNWMSHAINNAGDGSGTNPKVALYSDNRKNSLSFREGSVRPCMWALVWNATIPTTICEFVVKYRIHAIVHYISFRWIPLTVQLLNISFHVFLVTHFCDLSW